jgi:hypothetical protein
MINQPVVSDMPVNILDNNQLLECIKKWNIFPYQFMEAYRAVKVKTIYNIQEYLIEKGIIQNSNIIFTVN